MSTFFFFLMKAMLYISNVYKLHYWPNWLFYVFYVNIFVFDRLVLNYCIILLLYIYLFIYNVNSSEFIVGYNYLVSSDI